MRKTFGAALAGLTALAGGALIAGAASAQTYYGYYYNPPPTTYYYTPPVNSYVTPVVPAPNYYTAPGLAGAVIGTILGSDAFATVPGVPVDQFGPDPNGMVAPDGHLIKCKLRNEYDYNGAYMTRRECWETYSY